MAIAAALLVGTGLLYAKSLHFPFCSFDDPFYVVNNPHVRTGLTADNIGWALTTGERSNWHPLTWMSLQLDASLFGADSAKEFRAVNILLHAANAALIFCLLVTMTGSVGRSAAVAAVWAAHPLHVESVVWVTERKDVLSTFLGLLAVIAYTRYVRGPTTNRYALVVVLLALGLMAKPMLVTLPCVLLLLDFWPLGRTQWAKPAVPGSPPVPPVPPGKLIVEKLPLVAVAIVSAVVTMAVQSRGGAVGSLSAVAPTTRALNAVAGYGSYLFQTAWPADLAVFYPYVVRSVADPLVLASGLILVAVTAGCVGFARKRPYLLIGWLWFLGTLVPVIGLVQIGSQDHADRYTYLPHIGLFVAAVWGIADLQSRWPRLQVALAVIAVAASAVVTWKQIDHWRDSESLWTHTLEVTGGANPMARLHLGGIRRQANRQAEALPDLEVAVELDPKNPYARVQLGGTLVDLNRPDEAVVHLAEAVRLTPNDPLARQMLGWALVKSGRGAEAVPHFQAAGVTNGLAPAAMAVAVVRDMLARKDVPAARNLSKQLVAAAPLLAEPHYLLGACDDLENKPDDAAGHFREAIRLAPNYSPALAALAANEAAAGRFPQAVELSDRAVAAAEKFGNAELAAELRRQGDRYRAGKTLRDQP